VFDFGDNVIVILFLTHHTAPHSHLWSLHFIPGAVGGAEALCNFVAHALTASSTISLANVPPTRGDHPCFLILTSVAIPKQSVRMFDIPISSGSPAYFVG
jgi:hypothetical protein